ncbi:riboflavin biosynthesis protein RibD [Sulfobacillus acidophilus TPY]|uniref:Riboflavin biosynthesis protein RibD n=1 Tax=Sulfobacillus acidophilus (strain ATCC 700253 / DSM 10332 / NAL) TaxID=679936 RepID=G8TWT7_SULAD|nr:riboflavin biosynthesis protein RibD [Sulfobacillus acidophilus TPY]AEW03785.1 diaminohydroxyphosphoribosylaminopyrimidine deaminase [Sulfobacillus acidophilus DSM 10332]
MLSFGVTTMSPAMKRALQLAKRGRGRTSPNPLVGAVIVDDQGTVIGEGYHRRAGTDHAEVVALKAAGDRARGHTLYVTLEPCNHHGRTPPCTEAIIAAGIRRVVVATRDPNPEVTGHGIERLQAAGIVVEVGDGQAAAEALNRPFMTWSRKHRPYVILKAAMSLDGKVATAYHESKYLTSESALAHAHRLRRETDAILVGVGTVLADDPALTDRGPGRRRDPVRVVLDSHGRTPATARLLTEDSPAPALVFTTDRAPAEWERAIFSAGGEVIRVPANPHGQVDLTAVLTELADRRLLSLLVEGGPTVHWSFIQAGLADSWVGYIAPKILGGENAPTPVAGPGFHLPEAPGLTITHVWRRFPDVILWGEF